MRYLLHSPEGVYLKKVDNDSYDLLNASDLKEISLKDVVDPHKAEICILKDFDKVYAIPITAALKPRNCVLITQRHRLMYSAYHAIVCFELKSQLAYFAQITEGANQAFVHKLLFACERIFMRGNKR